MLYIYYDDLFCQEKNYTRSKGIRRLFIKKNVLVKPKWRHVKFN